MRRFLATISILAMAVSVSACGRAGEDDVTISAEPLAASVAGVAETVDVRVYFARGGAVATAGRSVSAPTVAQGAMEALLAGPQGIEIEIGMGTEIPAGTQLLGLDVADGTATVDLSGAFEAGGGSLSMQVRVAQVVFTLTQFETVDTVRFRIDGEPVEAIGGEGVLVDGVDRSSFTNVTPAVLVESPVPGQSVASPLAITGMANTFEATVNYAVTDGDGLIVDEGFTTATAGMGTFGDFSITSTFAVPTPGLGSVIAFEISARDGSQINVYEVPVRMTGPAAPGPAAPAAPAAPTLTG